MNTKNRKYMINFILTNHDDINNTHPLDYQSFREYIKNELELSSTDDLITEYEYYLNRHNIGASTFNFQ